MGTVFRKFTAIALAALLCLSFVPLSAFATEQADSSGVSEDVSSIDVPSVATYLYIESPELVSGSVQNIVVGVSDGIAAEDVELVYSRDGVSSTAPVAASTDGALLFALEGLTAGTYALEGLSYSSDGIEDFESFESLEGAACSFSVREAEGSSVQEQGAVEAYYMDEETESLASTGDISTFSADDVANEDIVASVVSYVTSSDDATAFSSEVEVAGNSDRAVSSKIVVAIDPGHGGYDPGASANGLKESDLTWAIAQACKTQLESYGRYTVFLTRAEDENPKQSERVNRAVQAGAALFVSIHINSADATSAHGAEVWIPNDHGYLNNQTHDLSESIADKILDNITALGLSDRGLKIKDATDDDVYDDGTPADYFTVISEARRAGIPSMIVEHAFISNASDASKLADPAFLKKLGIADAKGIASTFSFANPQIQLSADSLKPGAKLTMSVKGIQGQTSDLTYNFAYKTVDNWSVWDSTAKQTGSFTSKNSYTFTLPTKTGMYEAWVNVRGSNGVEQTTIPVKFTISKDALDWAASTTNAPSSVALGESVTFSSDASGDDVGKLSFNYAWSYEGGWSLWDSTVKSTGKMTSEKSCTFKPSKAGTYHVWVDVKDPTGRTVTTETALVKVEAQSWTAGTTIAPKTGKVGETVEFSAAVSGSGLSTLKYNYAWSYEGGWSLWDSTVKSTGKMTSAKSGSFKPAKAGTYHVWVDVEDSTGRRVTTKTALVKIASLDWNATTTKAPASGKVGQSITFSAVVSGADTKNLTYNYAWSYGGGWSEWGSTVKSTGKATTSSTGSFTPKKPGRYVLWVDVIDKTGRKVTTSSAVVDVNDYDWAVKSVAAPASSKVGQLIEFSANVTGTDVSKLTYSYAWSYEGGWDLWDSTLKSTGKMTAEKTGSFTPTKAGTYELWVDVCDAYGRTVSTSTVKFEAVGEPIMGATQTSVDQMVRAYERSGHAYPAKVYASRGAATLRDFCTLIYEEAKVEGVRAEVLFAQVMHETGWLQFGGDVKAEQCNFGGLGATGGGAAGATFPDVRTGLRAQVQHLKAYGSTLPLVNVCVDPRFKYVTRGCAPLVEDLGGKWAVGSQYGITLVTGMKALLKS